MIWIIMIAFMVSGGIVSSRLKSKIKKYSKIPTISGKSGKEIAEKMLSDNNITQPAIPDEYEGIQVKAHLLYDNEPLIVQFPANTHAA